MASTTKKTELLAPAGDLSCGLAAFDNGADAVYAALGNFNARYRAVNFTQDQLGSLIAYAHKLGRRVYVTFNTLIKDGELQEAAAMIRDIAGLLPDAFIVQDIGVIHMLRQYFPNQVIHASTQMCTHNSAGVQMLESMGVSRVILERQITLDELKLLRSRTSLELEVFVHGALCCCLSGSCLFSSWMGGWSGNRGRCKQPCRRRFHTDEGNGFFFSTNDLYSLNILDQLADIGIDSFKIEGRLRENGYVADVVRAYRMVMDAESDGRASAVSRARKILGNTGGRKWSGGFRSVEDFSSVVDHARPGVSGTLCGEVVSVKDNGFTIRASRRICLGDTLRVQGQVAEDGVSLKVTRMSSKGGKGCPFIRRDSEGFIFCDKEVQAGQRVYVTSSQGKDYSDRIDSLPVLRGTIQLSVRVSPSGIAIETLNLKDHLAWNRNMGIPAARTVSLSPERIAMEMRKIDFDGWRCEAVGVQIEGDLFLQDRDLRRIRQEFAETLKVGGIVIESPGYLRLASALKESFDTSSALPVEETDCDASLPFFCPECDLDNLKSKIKQMLEFGSKRFRVTSLYQIRVLSQLANIADLDLIASYPLTAANRMAARCLLDLGFSRVMLHPELGRGSIESLVDVLGPLCEVYVSGRIPILITRAKLAAAGDIVDGRGGGFRIVESGGLTYVYPARSYSIAPPAGNCSIYKEKDCGELREDGTSGFNYDRELV